MQYLLLDTAIRAAVRAGQAIMNVYTDPAADFDIAYKADHSPLTRADKAAHQCIVELLSSMAVPILSEEGEHLPYSERKDWKQLWIVDPLDGTKEFIKRNGDFTVNIALVEQGRPVAGVIYVPVHSELYFGLVGQGAWKLNGVAPSEEFSQHESLTATLAAQAECLTPGSQQEERPFTVVASRSHLSDETAAFIDNLRQTHPDLVTASRGSSLKLCMVAEGRADIYPRHAPTMEWDTAAGHAIALAAGHRVYDALTGEPLVYNKEDLHNPRFVVE